MNRRTFLKAVGATIIAPSLPMPQMAVDVSRVPATGGIIMFSGGRQCGKTYLHRAYTKFLETGGEVVIPKHLNDIYIALCKSKNEMEI